MQQQQNTINHVIRVAIESPAAHHETRNSPPKVVSIWSVGYKLLIVAISPTYCAVEHATASDIEMNPNCRVINHLYNQ